MNIHVHVGLGGDIPFKEGTTYHITKTMSAPDYEALKRPGGDDLQPLYAFISRIILYIAVLRRNIREAPWHLSSVDSHL